jgi:hypothetical protein
MVVMMMMMEEEDEEDKEEENRKKEGTVTDKRELRTQVMRPSNASKKKNTVPPRQAILLSASKLYS